jgi:long-chain acyl-CoA synthetase
VRLAEDGEILVHGDNVFSGYLNRPEETAAALVDGWLHTGDLGAFTDEGYLKTSPLIGQMVVHADDKPYVTALIVLDPEAFPVWAGRHGVPAGDPAAAADHPAVQEEIARAVVR